MKHIGGGSSENNDIAKKQETINLQKRNVLKL